MKITFWSLCLLGIVAVAIASPELRGRTVAAAGSAVSAQLDDCDDDCDD